MESQEFPLRYGCNPHQIPARVYMKDGALPLQVLNGSPSYINFMDALNGWQLVRELRQALEMPAAASFKHVSPAGAAVGTPLSDVLKQAYFVENIELTPLATAYARARGTDRVSSYGDWVALSDVVDVATARLLRPEVSDGVIAPGYEDEALTILRRKKQGNYRIFQIDPDYSPPEMERRDIFGITLEQRRNDAAIGRDLLTNVITVTKHLPTEAEQDLLVAYITLKYTQSNSVCFALGGQTIGIGAGQQSRIHCTRLAAAKAQTWHLRQHPSVLALSFREKIPRPTRDNLIDQYIQDGGFDEHEEASRTWLLHHPPELLPVQREEWLAGLRGVALGSDGYIPFRDNIDAAHRYGVYYIVQPGGSIRDEDVIEACDAYGIVMVCTNLRLFHH